MIYTASAQPKKVLVGENHEYRDKDDAENGDLVCGSVHTGTSCLYLFTVEDAVIGFEDAAHLSYRRRGSCP